ncbi:hypothetical protein [Epilithonimonas lactis]|uniref:Uncharacterized protein n=1 Tax=Epilithonimonas lactis TaxID=421072 RepID=A0A085B751_9FLAO|nr:hypothetical protein [Epilithonimonas lactis]KFC18296.1 hypothetical protein IO89_17475 [Epilithonimonas lactis]SER05664.1 hypothetical protein SAMN04488097_3808 [Epilithonimonas lactis]
MHPFSVTFQTSDHLVFKIISGFLALFIVGTWLYNSKDVKLLLRLLGAVVGGFAIYYVAVLFFGILQFSYTTVKDNFNPNKQSAKIIRYEKHISKTSRNRTGSSRRKQNTFYKPLLEYKGADGTIKNTFGDVSFSTNNKKAIGEKVEVIVETGQLRMITPMKNFAFAVNILSVCFLMIFYYFFYNYARRQSFEGVGTFVLSIFGFVIFPIAFGLLIYLFLNIGYEYFFQNKRFVSKNVAILLSGLGIFLMLCFVGYIRILIENVFLKKGRKKKKKKEKNSELMV